MKPYICTSFATELFICISWLRLFAYAIWQWKTNQDLHWGLLVVVIDGDWYADIETAVEPFAELCNTTYIGRQTKVMGDGFLKYRTMLVEMSKKRKSLIPICQLVKNVCFICLRLRKCDVLF